MSHKHQSIVLAIVSTIITFVFFLGFIYFSYFTAKELLTEKLISNHEYAMYHNSWEYEECKSPYSYKIEQYISQDEKYISSEASILTPEQKQNNKELRSHAMNKCFEDIELKASFQKNVDFKRSILKYTLAMSFFLILFLAFSAQSEKIYRGYDHKSKGKKKNKKS